MSSVGSIGVLGVTGGIASGKSLVAAVLADLGAAVLSADDLAREVVAPGEDVLAQLVETFGTSILTAAETLDREALGRRVFRDAEERRKLNAIIHPAIAARADRRLDQLRAGSAPLIVYEAPLLFEAGGAARVDAVLVVFAAPEIQIDRLCRRDGIDRAAAENRIAAHWPQHAKLARADFVLDNSGTIEATQSQVEALYDYLTRPGQAH